MQAVLTFFSQHKVSHYFFIGDLVGYGANPNECIELIKSLNCHAIAGNHDYGALQNTEIDNFNNTAKAAILWTIKTLSATSLKFLETLMLQKQERNCLLVHSSPQNPDAWEYIFTLKQAQIEFEFFKEQICFIGHSHCPFIVEKDERKSDFRLVPEQKIKIKDNTRYLINVGSVGQPRDGDTRACLSILDTKNYSFEFHRCEYNIKFTQQKIIDAGLPAVLAHRLAQGK
jgi:diadenosine tetraphosphatase ApaH/serine/threonine PP2A family protein phosphatase